LEASDTDQTVLVLARILYDFACITQGDALVVQFFLNCLPNILCLGDSYLVSVFLLVGIGSQVVL
jgi:hypothetical protein